MTEKRGRIGLAVASAIIVAALGLIIFVPGVGCQGNEVSNVSKQARMMSGARHRYESLSQYLDAKRKLSRGRQGGATTTAAAPRTPQKLTAYRVGTSLGSWNHFIWFPSRNASDERLSYRKLKYARQAALGLQKRLKLATDSAKAAKLAQVASAAAAAAEYSGDVNAALAGDRFDAAVLAKMNRLMGRLESAGKRAGLKIVSKTPPTLAG